MIDAAPFPGAVLPVGDQPVQKPADRNSVPDHGNAPDGRKDHSDSDADQEIDKVGDGEHFHITGSAQQAVYGHLEADQTEEPADEAQIVFTGFQRCGRTAVSQEKCDEGTVEQFQSDAEEKRRRR